MTALDNSLRELRQAEDEVARLEAIAAENPGKSGAKRLLTWEREHAARVRNFLRACGVKS
jgi:hypothetical protein